MPAVQSKAEALEPGLSVPQCRLTHHPNNFRTPQTKTFHLLLALLPGSFTPPVPQDCSLLGSAAPQMWE